MEKTEQIPVKMSDETQNIPEVISTAKPDEKKQSVGALIEVLPRTLHKKSQANFTTYSRNFFIGTTGVN